MGRLVIIQEVQGGKLQSPVEPHSQGRCDYASSSFPRGGDPEDDQLMG